MTVKVLGAVQKKRVRRFILCLEAFYNLSVQHKGRPTTYLTRFLEMSGYVEKRHALFRVVMQDSAQLLQLRVAYEGAYVLQHHQMIACHHCL